jgi:hypothetical protein
MPDLDRAAAFMATHARLLDRRRLALARGAGAHELAIAALAGYANPDGGFGWGLEPDLRGPTSQPGGALHAFELLEEVAPATSPIALRLLDWLDAIALEGGALPFALPGAGGPGDGPWWAMSDPREPSLHATAMLAAAALRVCAFDAAAAAHPWPGRAVAWCRPRIEALTSVGDAYETRFVLDLLDALAEREAWAGAELARIVALLPASLEVPVGGGADGEVLRPLELAPRPAGPLRDALDSAVLARALDALAGEQAQDGGWTVGFPAQSPISALEWRGYATVGAVRLLRAAGRL